MKKYANVALPIDLIVQIDKIIKKGGLGYKSRGEIVKEAVRNLIKSIKNNH
jgi:metal-responsive CopG/Arc/MetJ family transcriptional regulator